MIQLTREEAQQVLAALQSLFGVPDKYTGLGGGAVAVWRLGGSAAPMDAISILQSKLEEPAPKPMTDEEIDDALSDIWGSDTGEVLSAHLQRKIARAIEARMNRV